MDQTSSGVVVAVWVERQQPGKFNSILLKMKAKYVICPDINIESRPFKDYSKENNAHDWRSLASEYYAFDYIGIKHILCEETELINKYAHRGIKIPECIAIDPHDSKKTISVEAKRICGNHLPADYEGQKRRILRSRDKIVWPWTATIRNSLIKAHPSIVNDFCVHTHHSIFILPSSLPDKKIKRVCSRIQSFIENCDDLIDCKLVVHIITGKDNLFDRL